MPTINSSHKNIIQLANIFCVNKTEAEIFTNNSVKIDGIQSATQVLSQLLEQWCVIIILRHLGAVFASRKQPGAQMGLRAKS